MLVKPPVEPHHGVQNVHGLDGVKVASVCEISLRLGVRLSSK